MQTEAYSISTSILPKFFNDLAAASQLRISSKDLGCLPAVRQYVVYPETLGMPATRGSCNRCWIQTCCWTLTDTKGQRGAEAIANYLCSSVDGAATIFFIISFAVMAQSKQQEMHHSRYSTREWTDSEALEAFGQKRVLTRKMTGDIAANDAY